MNLNLFKSAAAFLMLSLVPACADHSDSTTGGTGGGGSGGGGDAMSGGAGSGGAGSGGSGGVAQPVAPTVVSTTPFGGAIDVPINGSISAVFSEAMDPSTLTETTFTLTSEAGGLSVPGTVLYASSTAVFWPAAHLASNNAYTAMITTGAESSAGLGLATSHAWTFTTGAAVAPGLPVSLGMAGDYVILAKAAISTVPTSAVTGDVALSPAAATFITGFSLSADATETFSTSPQVIGRLYAADYAPPTPANLTTAVGDMELAFTDAAARAPDVTELGAGNIGGMTLLPGVYKWGSGLLIPTDVTLNGSATDVWIFQIAQNLTVSDATNVVLAGGALPENIFWQVAGLVDVGTTAHLEGVVLAQTSITMHTGASINGRLLAQTAVNIDSSTVVEPTN